MHDWGQLQYVSDEDIARRDLNGRRWRCEND